LHSGKSHEDFAGMPIPQRDWEAIADNPLLAEQLDFDCITLRETAETCLATFNPEQ
jgi:hypothetical protein